MSDTSQMFTCCPYSSAQNRRGGFAAQRFPPMPSHRLCYCVHTSPWHGCTHWNGPARPCLGMMTYFPFHSVRCANILSLSYHCHRSSSSNRSHPPSNLFKGYRQDLTSLCVIVIDSWSKKWQDPNIYTPILILPWPFLGVSFSTTSPATPEGNGGRKNVDGGSKFPPGRLLDGEGERWTDDNGREAGAWVSPQGDLHPTTCWLQPLH